MLARHILRSVVLAIACLAFLSRPAAAEDTSKLLQNVRWTGSAVTLDGLRGKTVVVLDYATWCPICSKWSPDLCKQIKAAVVDRPVVVLAIDTDEQAGNWRQGQREVHGRSRLLRTEHPSRLRSGHCQTGRTAGALGLHDHRAVRQGRGEGRGRILSRAGRREEVCPAGRPRPLPELGPVRRHHAENGRGDEALFCHRVDIIPNSSDHKKRLPAAQQRSRSTPRWANIGARSWTASANWPRASWTTGSRPTT